MRIYSNKQELKDDQESNYRKPKSAGDKGLLSVPGLFAKTKSCTAQECSVDNESSVPVPVVY